MPRLITTILLALAVVSVSSRALATDDPYEAVYGDVARACQKPGHHCWQQTLDDLRKLPPASTEREKQGYLLSYYMISKFAYWVGDNDEAKHLFTQAMQLAKGIEIDKGVTAEPVVTLDAVPVYLITRDYPKALGLLDQAQSGFARYATDGQQPAPLEMDVFRAASLIGLRRDEDADALLEQILGRLDFNERVPFEEWGVGPEPVDPYAFGRRVAARYFREGRTQDALSLLDLLDAKRAKAMAVKLQPGEIPVPTWAERTDVAELLYDRAVIQLSQGKPDVAAELFNRVLSRHKDDASAMRKHALLRLAKIKRDVGKLDESNTLQTAGEKIVVVEEPRTPDPLADTLGWIDERQ